MLIVQTGPFLLIGFGDVIIVMRLDGGAFSISAEITCFSQV